jgi:hypothetical protein
MIPEIPIRIKETYDWQVPSEVSNGRGLPGLRIRIHTIGGNSQLLITSPRHFNRQGVNITLTSTSPLQSRMRNFTKGTALTDSLSFVFNFILFLNFHAAN